MMLPTGSLFAQTVLPSGSIAVVNGSEISNTYFNFAMKSAVAQGQKDSPELQNLIKRKLITNAVLSQRSVREGLDKSPSFQMAITQVREGLLAETLISDYIAKNPVSDADVRAEYERQIGMLGPTGTIPQYQIGEIALSTEAEANAALARIKKGESFANVAKAMSLSPNKSNGGSLGWVYLTQLSPEVAKAVSSMGKGTISAAPINTANAWYIVKVDEKRLVKPPSLEESKDLIRNNLMQKKVNDYVSKLMNEATIVQ